MKGIKKTWLYKYISYRFEKETIKNHILQNLNKNEKENICIEVTNKTRKVTWIILMIYIPVFLFFVFGFVMNYNTLGNPFIKWYIGVYESVFPLINGDWGSAWYEKRATILIIIIKLLPAVIIQAAPLFIPIFITANATLKNRIKEIIEKDFENEK